jgi:ribonuclease P protein component
VLHPSERLRKKGLFQRIYSARKSASCQYFTLLGLLRHSSRVTQGAQLDQDRVLKLPLVGFVVSKKTLNKAVDRNKAKRRVREAYRSIRLKLPELSNWYALVFIIHKEALGEAQDADFEVMREAVVKLIKQVDKKYGKETSSMKKTED